MATINDKAYLSQYIISNCDKLGDFVTNNKIEKEILQHLQNKNWHAICVKRSNKYWEAMENIYMFLQTKQQKERNQKNQSVKFV